MRRLFEFAEGSGEYFLVAIVNFVDEKASRFHAFQQGRADFRHLIPSKA